jgi:cobyrinic acid a,c-diamide synthase
MLIDMTMGLSLKNDGKTARLCIAGTHSGCGKTTVSLGIMAALVLREYSVQAFKVGPDFIDPGHHFRVTGRHSHNLDGWIMDLEQNRRIFARYSNDAHVSVVEGVMGLFDGFSGTDEAGSTAQMAKWLDLPVMLIIDARAMARSAAAVAKGFSLFDPGLSLQGIIFNHVGTKGHAHQLEEALRFYTGLPLLGCLPDDKELEIPSRHLGLVTDEDFAGNEPHARNLAHWIEENLDVDSLIKGLVIRDRVSLQANKKSSESREHTTARVKIGVAMDEAFCFYYQENLRLLKEAGAVLVPFSPLHERHLPEGIQGLFLGGGYPELHCRTLAENLDLLDEIKGFGRSGMPVYAECGGLMFLMEEIQDLQGDRYPMAGLFHMSAKMETKLHALGYREVTTKRESILGPAGTRVKGHEFHYSSITAMGDHIECIYSMNDRTMRFNKDEGFFAHRVLGSYVHLHWGSNPEVATFFVAYCGKFGNC